MISFRSMVILLCLLLFSGLVVAWDCDIETGDFEDCDFSQATPEELSQISDEFIQDIPESDRTRVIEAKFPNTNFEGDITGDVTLSGGELIIGNPPSTFDLNTLRGTIRSNQDGSFTFNEMATASGADNVRDEGGKTKIDNAKELKNEPQASEPQVTGENVQGAEVGSDEWYFALAASLTVTDPSTNQQFSASNVQGFRMTTSGGKPQVSFEHADDFTFEGSQALDVNDFLSGMDFSYSFNNAAEFKLDGINFKDLCDSNFEVKGNTLINAHVCSDKDDNVFAMPNPITTLGSMIYVHANRSKTFDVEYTKLISGPVPSIAIGLRLDKDVVANMTSNGLPAIELRTKHNSGKILAVQQRLPLFLIEDAELAYKARSFNEMVDSAGLSRISLSFDTGMGYVILAPISSPGGRYVYEDKEMIEKSFAIYNPSSEPYEVGFRKTSTFFDYDEFKSVMQGNGHGYVNFVDNEISLNGEVEYEKYGSEQIGTKWDIRQAALMDVYNSNDVDNKATMSMDNDNAFIYRFFLDSNPATETFSMLFNGFFTLMETLQSRFLRIESESPSPVLNYAMSYREGEIVFENKTLMQTTPLNMVTAFSPGSKAQTDFEKQRLIVLTETGFRQRIYGR